MARVIEVAPRMAGGAVVVDVRTFKGDSLGQAACGNHHSAYTGIHELADGLNQAFDAAVALGISIATGIPRARAAEMLTAWYEDELDKQAKAEEAAEQAETQPAPQPSPPAETAPPPPAVEEKPAPAPPVDEPGPPKDAA